MYKPTTYVKNEKDYVLLESTGVSVYSDVTFTVLKMSHAVRANASNVLYLFCYT
jgi:hypothetical protein